MLLGIKIFENLPFFTIQGTELTEIYDGETITSGPSLPQGLDSGEPCAVKINDTSTFIGNGHGAYIYNWVEDAFTTLNALYRINGVAGCGSAITSTGQRQVVIAGNQW